MDINKYRHIIWDWNGTLLNDVDYCIACMNQLLKKRQMQPLEKARYRDIFTFPVEDYYKEIGFDFAKDPFDVVGHEFIHSYYSDLSSCGLHPQAKGLLQFFQKSAKQQFVLSAMEHQALLNFLKSYDILHYFEGVYGIDNHLGAGKIDRAQSMIESHHIDMSQALLIGDTLHDKEVADELGCDILLVAQGHQSRLRLKASGAKVVDSLSDMIQ